ncbi:MAG: hypothetical protein NZR01_04895 [Bryobacteraceae bacterium]|nr:hypothetical protein [Bryobacteraceae bacterium]
MEGLVWTPVEAAPDAGTALHKAAPLVLSWPDEWTAEHWRDAAAHVLSLEEALRGRGWTLRAVRPQWIQFRGCRPVWISQAALAPFDGLRWPGRESFVREFLEPLRRSSQDNPGSVWVRLWRWRHCKSLARLASGHLPAVRGEDLRLLRAAIGRCVPGKRWSPCQVHDVAAEPAGIAGIVAKEEARLRGAALVYEWRQRQARGAKLAPPPGPAWVRFHESGDQAAADYLEERAAGGAALPLAVQSLPDSRPRRSLEADLAVIIGRGNLPRGLSGLGRLAAGIRAMARAVVVEFIPEIDVSWHQFLSVFAADFRISSVVEAGAGRRVCVMERMNAAAAPLLVA